ncbi:hypothetical protein F4Z98_05990 [Candidatus Poribacteria bacterium]|nr:hypothetical protein [Candidatus Poribacteria bacterium]MYB01770.1 hypothetical protein [Candidatus Poribacteria bacterium]
MKWALVILMTAMLSFSGFTDHEADSNRVIHRKQRWITDATWRKIAKDSDAPLTSGAMCFGHADGRWSAHDRVKSNANQMTGRWSMITGGPGVYDDHNLHEYVGNITRKRKSNGDIGQAANPSVLVDRCFSLLNISGQQGSGSTWLLSSSNIPW